MAPVNTDTTNEDTPSVRVTFPLVLFGLECIAGVAGNSFITAVHGTEWARRRRLPAGDLILLLLSVWRLLLQVWVLLESTLGLFFRGAYNQNAVYTLFKVVLMFLNYTNLWLAAWLNVFYCLRVANFTHPLFFMMKRRVLGFMPWLVRLSLLLALCFSFPFSKDIFNMYVNSSIPVPASNCTEKKYISETNVVSLVLLYNLSILLPLGIFILAATLLIASLKKHTQHMKSTATGCRDPSMQAHVGAIKAISSFLLLYIFNAVALFLSMSNIFEPSSPWNALCKVIMAAYPSGHSVLLILSNPGLRRAWKRLQQRVRLYPRGRAL
ncbi:taste receptor type 2 member 40 [Orycteropus afer afer]|uniref:Taste receptor type 2 n=1 Tax=Orycteropus afer afer TaxID=1230840 RepID=A0A8B7B7S0_ORYAF|nr:taste receptor type 2 member 40 [Orycteropus afer afer]